MTDRSPLMILAAVLALSACGSPPATATPDPTTPVETPGRSDPPPPAGRIVDGFFLAEGAPDPLACATDADCTYGQTYDASGCCGTYRDMAAAAQSTAYRAWQDSYTAAHCADHPCPSPPVPDAPPDCLFDLHCAAGRCDNACTW